MPSLLHVSASPRGAESESLAIAHTFLGALQDKRPDVSIDTFDLWDGSLPEFGPAAAAAKTFIFAAARCQQASRPQPGRPPSARSAGSPPPTTTCSACRCGTTASPTS